MELEIHVEKPSKILRKLKIKVPSKAVSERVDRGLAELQRTAKIKGFRPGFVPINVIRQHYETDVKHQVYHSLIDESYKQAVRDQKIRAVGSPRIETAQDAAAPKHDHKHDHDHDHDHDHSHDHHTLEEGKDLEFTATVEILPEIEVKGADKFSLKRQAVDVTDKDVENVIQGLRESQAQLVPASAGGLLGADGAPQSRPAQMGDFVEVEFDGGIVQEDGSSESRPGMKGQRLIELGSKSLIDGFEEAIVGLRAGESKTFEVPFPKDYSEESLAGKMSRFTVNVQEVKEKKLPELDEEFAKGMGYESLPQMKEQAHAHLIKEKTMEADRKLRSDLLASLIEKNPFDVPQSLIEAQTRSLAQDLAQTLKQQGFDDNMIQSALMQELDKLKKRAENQVRASLLLEAIADQEKIEVAESDVENELRTMATSMRVEEEKVREYYGKNPARRDDLEYRIREDKTVQLLMGRAKIS